jgi:hypothetical protein
LAAAMLGFGWLCLALDYARLCFAIALVGLGFGYTWLWLCLSWLASAMLGCGFA